MIKEYDAQAETFTIPTMIKFLQAAPSESAVPQRRPLDHLLNKSAWVFTDGWPAVGDLVADWRWPPQPKIIDMSYMIGNNVDCEFSDSGKKWDVGKLLAICNNTPRFESSCGYVFKYCRPRHNEWLAHTGDKCPVPEVVAGQVMLRHGTVAAMDTMSPRNR